MLHALIKSHKHECILQALDGIFLHAEFVQACASRAYACSVTDYLQCSYLNLVYA